MSPRGRTGACLVRRACEAGPTGPSSLSGSPPGSGPVRGLFLCGEAGTPPVRCLPGATASRISPLVGDPWGRAAGEAPVGAKSRGYRVKELPPPPRDYYYVHEVAALLGVSDALVYRRIWLEELPARKLLTTPLRPGRRTVWVVPIQDFHDFYPRIPRLDVTKPPPDRRPWYKVRSTED